MPGVKGQRRAPKSATVRERILTTVTVDPKTDCWNWLNRVETSNGYGRIVVNGRALKAHRASYEEFVGPIPEGLVIDHLCRNRKCVNPAHLEPVTAVENTRRGEGLVWQINAAATHCYRGHPLSGENLYVPRSGNRHCRKCRQLRRRAQYLRTGR